MRRKTTYKTRSAGNSVNTLSSQEIFNGNIEELVNVLNAIPEDMTAHNLSFANQPNKETAIKRILAGDPDLFHRYEKSAKNAKLQGYNSKAYLMENEGLFFDVSAYLTGAPEHWINEVETQELGPAKDIKINIAAPYWVREEDIFCKLIKIVELIDSTEATGQRLSIKIVLYCSDYLKSGRPCHAEIEIKKDSEPLNIQQLVYLIANPILLRYAFLSIKAFKNINYRPVSNLPMENEFNDNTEAIYIPSISWDYNKRICYTGNERFNYNNLEPIKEYSLTI